MEKALAKEVIDEQLRGLLLHYAPRIAGLSEQSLELLGRDDDAFTRLDYTLHYSRSWAVEGDVNVRAAYNGVRFTVEVNSGSTRRTPAEACAYAALMRDLADLACLLEAELRRWPDIDRAAAPKAPPI